MAAQKYSIDLLLVLFLVLVFLLERPAGAGLTVRCKASERQALLDFKNSLAAVNDYGDSGISSWGSDQDENGNCCSWVGVGCSDSTGHVVKLDLRNNIGNVTGTISPSLLQLSYLDYLDLSYNDFNGSHIPKFLGSFKRLTYLDLSESYFSGPIPSQLGNLSRLVTFDLSLNRLTGSIPDTFRNLDALRDFSLSNNLLDGEIPRFLWNICSLHSLDLRSNKLRGDVFGFLQTTSSCTKYSLEYLDLTDNQLTGSVPKEIAKLSSLQVLSLGYNLLNGTISQDIGKLFNLTTLELPGNSFDNVVISEAHFSNLSNLLKLDLSYTSLALKFNSGWIPPFQLDNLSLRSCKLGPRFPEWLRYQDVLPSYIDFSAARISDSIPSWFLNKSRPVVNLNLSFNQISGTLPNNCSGIFPSQKCCICSPFIDLSSNNFTGPLPQLPSVLVSLNLSKNKFSGSITSICEFSDTIRLLDLSSNLFSGVIPQCSGRWFELKALNLAENNLSGSIPSWMGSRFLQMLSLRSNGFSGELPSSLGNCWHLKFMDLSDNKLSGNIPDWIGESFSFLIFLSLRNNQFNGTIPHQLCGLNKIQILDLSVNKISGTLPRCFSNFISMSQKVNLSRTIEHPISRKRNPHSIFIDVDYVDEALLTWKGKKQMYAKILGLLLVIDLSSNKLIGEIPEELTSLQELVALNLSRNLLTGKIPRKIGQLRQLQALDLSRNRISGSIPSSLSELTFLAILDLSYNHLSGKIPTGSQIQLFDPSSFSHNHGLCGPPVTPNCSGPLEKTQGQPGRGQDDFDEFRKWFYAGMGVGFVVGFWGFCGSVFFKRSWRYSYFRFLDNVKDSLYVSLVLLKARLMRRIQT